MNCVTETPAKCANEGVEAARRAVETAIHQAIPRLDKIEQGRLASICVPVSLALDQIAGWDCCWTAPSEHLTFFGRGEATRFSQTEAKSFSSECARWVLLTAGSRAPRAFFTLPPATEPQAPDLWVPAILVEQGQGHAMVTLTARRNQESAAAIADDWMRQLCLMLVAPSRPVHSDALAIVSKPDDAIWRGFVEAAKKAIVSGSLTKIVLARRISLLMSRPVDTVRLVRRLAQANPECCVFCVPHGTGHVIAASPERLVVKRGRRLTSHAVAGTIGRRADADADAEAARALMASKKERREHELVVEGIVDSLAGVCDELSHPAEPSLLSLRRVRHLWTLVTARLSEGVGLIDAAMRLHPTPAVLGAPRKAARDLLAHMGEKRDGLYTGVVGWIDRDGDGDAAVVLRAAYIEGRSVALWAGAGITADSDADDELAETRLKSTTMLEALQAT